MRQAAGEDGVTDGIPADNFFGSDNCIFPNVDSRSINAPMVIHALAETSITPILMKRSDRVDRIEHRKKLRAD